MAKATYQVARKDYPQHGIFKGEGYWKWSFRFGGTHYSKTKPKPSQLTQSEFLGRVYALSEDIDDFVNNYDDLTTEGIQEFVENTLIPEIEDLQDECENSLDNMPEGLQDGPTGELLQGRIEALEEMRGELECLEFVFFPSMEQEEIDAIEGEEEREEAQDEFNNELDDFRSSLLEELGAIAYGGE